jgi:hypothetical protein
MYLAVRCWRYEVRFDRRLLGVAIFTPALIAMPFSVVFSVRVA